MAQDTHFSFNNNIFPPTTGTGNSMLSDTDIVCQKILDFFRGIIESNISTRWTSECSACGMVNSNLQNLLDGYAVGNAICYPAPETMKSTDYKFPLLSVYRTGESFLQMTTTKVVVASDFVVTWTLPPLNTPSQLNHLYPFLALVSKTLMYYSFIGSDPKYNNGELVWKEAGFAFALMEGAKYGAFENPEGRVKFPSVQIRFKVFEQNRFVASDFTPLTGFDTEIDVTDGYNINNPLSTITLTTNPTFTVSSFSPSSGTIAGNTLIVIHGTGFQEAALSQTAQISIANNSPIRFVVNSDTTILAVTGYAIAPISGPITITDSSGNIATSSQNFTYS